MKEMEKKIEETLDKKEKEIMSRVERELRYYQSSIRECDLVRDTVQKDCLLCGLKGYLSALVDVGIITRDEFSQYQRKYSS